MRQSLLEYMAQMPMATNGAANGGPLSAAIPAANEGGVKNKTAKAPRLFRMYDDETDMNLESNDSMDSSTDNDSLLFQLFKQFIQDNKELLDVDSEVEYKIDQVNSELDSEDQQIADDETSNSIDDEMDSEDGMDITGDPADMAMDGDESDIDLYGKSPLNPEMPYQDEDQEQYGYENEEFSDDMDPDPAGVDMDQRAEYPEMNDDQSPEMSDMEGQDEEDPNKQGVIRVVKGAHLVYKRENAEGLFDELWFLNVGKQAGNRPQEVKQEILSGTDIHQNNTTSDDGSQTYDIWTVGNGQLLRVHGLPN